MTKAKEKDSSQPKAGRTGHEALAGHLDASLMDFNLAKEIMELHQEETWMRTGHNSKTLVKQPDLRIVLIALKKGEQLEEHNVDARISIHTLSGHVRLQLHSQAVDLPVGHLLALDRGIRHDVEAVEESALLLTLSWPKSEEHDG